MHFDKVISTVIPAFEKQGIRYALIGGFALAMRGVHRSTLDLDLILALEDMKLAESILMHFG